MPTIEAIVQDIADALKGIDSSGVPFKHYQPGVGPYAEVALLKQVAARFNDIPGYSGCVSVRQRTPDLLIRRQWALEVKLARPFGDNGEPAEDWSVNLLHPYEGSTSLLGDCLKLRGLACSEQKGVVAIGYEHDPPQTPLEPLWKAFEVIAAAVLDIQLGTRAEAKRDGLVHPVHQRLVVVGWEVT